MRIWSVHPKYLDSKGLVALWREALLAKNVLEGKTKGYKNHPQLIRFKMSEDPLRDINNYLAAVMEEAHKRGYRFDPVKITVNSAVNIIKVTSGQMDYERAHLLEKLKKRDPVRYTQFFGIDKFDTHPVFRVVEGEIESWEVVSK